MAQPDDDDFDLRLSTALEELLALRQSGRPVDVAGVAAKYPDLASEIRGLWATMQLAGEYAIASDRPDEVEPPPQWEPPLAPPRSFGDYELLEELGRGGMGVVYRARQLSLSRTVALKLMLRQGADPALDAARFRAEAEAAARLHHPNVVPVFEVGEVNGTPFFSMRRIDGVTLAERLADGPLPPREAARLLIPVCRAVAEAHRRGVLHRDLKPSNILIDREGVPYVTDFGLAKRIAAADGSMEGLPAARSLTHSGAVLGTPAYMAPEQAAGDRGVVGPGTDVYALGAILYAMLTGRAPFQAASPIDTVLMVLEQEPPPPRVLNPSADADLELIALKALQKPVDLRYSDPDALADDLERWLRHEPLAARSSHFTQILSRAFRPTHHAVVLENWGLLWIWHGLVICGICLTTNAMQLAGVASRSAYVIWWTLGLGAWAAIFWSLRRRAGPVTFVERQIAHIWAASMAISTGLFAVEALLKLPPLTLSPVLALVAAGVFVAKAGVLSGEFYIHAAALFLTALPMALFPRAAISIFGVVSGAAFLVPGWRLLRQRRHSTHQSPTDGRATISGKLRGKSMTENRSASLGE